MADLGLPIRRSPLVHRGPIAGEAIRLAERPFTRKHILRSRPDEAVERIRAASGLGLPFDALTSSTHAGLSALWMGPDEWMLVGAPGDAGQPSPIAPALNGLHHQLVDVSDYYTELELAGARARELLMKVTTIDLHPRAFRAGMVTGCIVGRANVTLWLVGDEAGAALFRIFVRWSMADYLWCLLADAGREWGLPRQQPVGGEMLTIAEG